MQLNKDHSNLKEIMEYLEEQNRETAARRALLRGLEGADQLLLGTGEEEEMSDDFIREQLEEIGMSDTNIQAFLDSRNK